MPDNGNFEAVIQDAPVIAGNGQTNQSFGDAAGALNCMHDQQTVIERAVPPRKYIVRRLTPLECCRLQGFPDWWLDGVEGSDSAKYRLWGNGVALPCAVDVLGRIADAMREEEQDRSESPDDAEPKGPDRSESPADTEQKWQDGSESPAD